MGEFSERRRGFDGQTLTVTKMTESQLLGDKTRDETIDLWMPDLYDVLDRALKDPSFVHIRLIDEHGTTIFNRVQLNEVLPELQRLFEFATSDGEAAIVQEVVDLAQEVMDSVHTFLVFLGD